MEETARTSENAETSKTPVANELAERQRRWSSEAAFFDQIASNVGLADLLLGSAVIERYRRARQPWFNKEFRFRLLGSVQGKRVLDIGCGEGSNSILLASLGARVTGVDVSPKCVEVARQRALRAALGEYVDFQCAPLETVMLPSSEFDIVWGDGILHHVIPELEPTFRRLMAWSKPEALFVFSEPYYGSPLLRRLRASLPIHTDATPDERPLGPAELAIVRHFIPDLHCRSFGLLAWLNRFVLAGPSYERTPLPRRLAASAVAMADYGLLSVPGVKTLGGALVLWGRPATR